MRAGGRAARRPAAHHAGARPQAGHRAVFVANPRVLATAPAALAAAARDGLAGTLADGATVETRADEANPARIADRIADVRADLLVVAGGDGTVGAAAEALMRLDADERPPLAILPFGTANNVARSLGLRSIRAADPASLPIALDAALRGRERPFDLGRVGDRVFSGSFALGMDADILRLRNAVRAWTGDVPPFTGYPLYLASCALNAAWSHGGRARVDGSEEARPVYGALALNVALYAGEFRFAPEDPSRDGRLDFHVFAGMLEYVGGYADAWRRQLAHGRGERREGPPTRRRVREVTLRFDRPVAAQIDGEELGPAAEWRIEADPAGLTVRVPRRRSSA